jgi:hypothetical protein
MSQPSLAVLNLLRLAVAFQDTLEPFDSLTCLGGQATSCRSASDGRLGKDTEGGLHHHGIVLFACCDVRIPNL